MRLFVYFHIIKDALNKLDADKDKSIRALLINLDSVNLRLGEFHSQFR